MISSVRKEDFLIEQLSYSYKNEEVVLHFPWPKKMKSILLYEYLVQDKDKFNWSENPYKKVARNEYTLAGGCVQLTPKLKGKIGIILLPVLDRDGEEVTVLQNDGRNELELIAQPIVIHVKVTELDCVARQLMRRRKRVELQFVPDLDSGAYVPEGTLEVQYSHGTWCVQDRIGQEGLTRVIEEPINSKIMVKLSKKNMQNGRLYQIQMNL